MKVLILFGSQSDELIFNKLIKKLQEQGQKVDFSIISAHRKPVELKEKLAQNDYDIVIAGAGLSAHLPGVVASLIYKPVFGIPVKSQFQGMDAYFSISQMPFGVPVISSFPNEIEAIAYFISKMEACTDLQVVYHPQVMTTKEFQRTEQWIEENNLNSIVKLIKSDTPNSCSNNNPSLEIFWGHKCDNELTQANPTLYVPFVEKPDSLDSALLVFQQAKGCLTLGVNQVRNAILFGLQILNTKNSNNNQLLEVIKNARIVK